MRAQGALPSALGRPIEEHLRGSAKELLRTRSAEYLEMVNEENMILMDRRHMGSSRA